MEDFPFVPFESEQKPDKQGAEQSASKKKRKTTKIPLPVVTSVSPGAVEAKQTQTASDAPEVAKDKEESTVEQADESPQDNELEVVTSDNEPDQQADPETAAMYDPMTLAREFSDEAPIIIERGEPVEAADVHEPRMNLEEEPEQEPVQDQNVEESPTIPHTPESPQPVEAVTPEASTPEAAPRHAPPFVPLFERPTPVIEAEERRLYEAPVEHTAEAESISTQEHERVIDRVRRRATSRGVLAGGVAGWWLGKRRGRAEAETAAKEVLQEREAQIKTLEKEQQVVAERLKVVERAAEQLPPVQPQPKSPEAVVTETLPLPTPEQVVQASKEADVEHIVKTPDTTAEVQDPVEDEIVEAPKGHRIETSAWHAYEVDEKTGKIVENQSFEYGEEFKREKKAERLRREAMQPQVAVQLGHALLADPHLQVDEQRAAVPQDHTPDVPRAASSHTSTQDIKEQLVRYTTSPVTWIAAGLLVVLLFAVGALR